MGETDYVTYGGQMALGGAITEVLPPNPMRVGVLFWNEAGGGLCGVAPGMSLPPTAMMPVPATGYVEFLYSKHGPLPSQAWYGQQIGAGAIINWVEIRLIQRG